MITPEITCTVSWVALLVDHHCAPPHGHSGPHECACGAERGLVEPPSAPRRRHLTQPTEREDRK